MPKSSRAAKSSKEEASPEYQSWREARHGLLMIAVFMVRRNAALICPEDLGPAPGNIVLPGIS